jgi:hypothetical protein
MHWSLVLVIKIKLAPIRCFGAYQEPLINHGKKKGGEKMALESYTYLDLNHSLLIMYPWRN